MARFWSIENSEYKKCVPRAHLGLLGGHREYHPQVGQHVVFILLWDLNKKSYIQQ